MKNSKKASLLLLSCLLFVGVNLLFSPKAEAVVTSQKQIEEGLTTLEFKNRSTIVGKFGADTINFIDRNPYDTGGGDYNYVPDEGFFCSTGDSVKGITIQNGAIAPDKFGKVAASVPASVDLDYNPLGTTADQGCKGEKALSAGVRTNGVAFSSFEWSGASLKETSSGENFKQLSSSVKEFYVADKGDDCYGNSVVVLSNDNQGVLYKLIKSSGVSKGRDASKDDVLKKYFTKSNECWVVSTFPTSVLGDRNKNLEQAKAAGTENGDQTPSCESNFSYGFEWILCPALLLADDMANIFTNFIEGQLTFCTGTSSTQGTKCSDNNLTPGVYKAWAIFRVIASVSLVIIMLVMVLSEAIGFGLFDAYTIRKLLPKLIIAVILIQISWVMFKWFIDLSNDLGAGIGDLMYAPFGGSDNITIDKLLGQGIRDFTGDDGNGFALFAGLAALTALWVSLPGIFTLGFFVVFALLTAFVTLVFRKLLIVSLVILSPIALACWILPGTERYWKMWLTNFQKVLLMFPLIIGLIAGGRIFAQITADATASSGRSFTSFAELAIIIVAYFGPLFFLPKTFAWGGEFMKMGSGAIKGGVDKIKAKPMEYAKNRGEGWREERRRSSKERVAAGVGFNAKKPSSWFTAPSDKFKSGQWDPLLGRKQFKIPGVKKPIGDDSRRRRDAILGYKAGGASAEEEEIKNAKLSNELEYGSLDESIAEDYVRMKARGRIGEVIKDKDGNFSLKEGREATVVEQRAALDKLATLGGEGNFQIIQDIHNDVLQNGTDEQRKMMTKYKDANAQALFKKLPHLYKNYTYSSDRDVIRTVDGLVPEDATSLSGTGFKAMRDTLVGNLLSAKAALDADPNNEHNKTAFATQRDSLKRLMTVLQQATQDENLKGHINADVARRGKELADGVGPDGNPDTNLRLARNILAQDPEASNAVSDISRNVQSGTGIVTENVNQNQSTPSSGAVVDSSGRGVPGAVFSPNAPGVANVAPVSVQIDHTAVANAVAEGVSSALTAHGGINVSAAPVNTVTSPGGVHLPEGSEEARRIEQERLNVERESLREQRESDSRREDEDNHPTNSGPEEPR